MIKDFPLPMLELLRKYPELVAVGRLVDCWNERHHDEKAQKIYCDIAELVRQLDFKAYQPDS